MLAHAQSQLLQLIQPVSVPSDHLGGPAGLPVPAVANLLSPAAPEAGVVVYGEVVVAAAQACALSVAAAVVDISPVAGGAMADDAAVEVGTYAAAVAPDAAVAVESVWDTRQQGAPSGHMRSMHL